MCEQVFNEETMFWLKSAIAEASMGRAKWGAMGYSWDYIDTCSKLLILLSYAKNSKPQKSPQITSTKIQTQINYFSKLLKLIYCHKNNQNLVSQIFANWKKKLKTSFEKRCFLTMFYFSRIHLITGKVHRIQKSNCLEFLGLPARFMEKSMGSRF